MRRLVLLLSLLALAVAPAGALAQSAGDEQYADPLAEEAQAPTTTATPSEEEPLSSDPPANLGSGSAAATPTPEAAASPSASGGAEADDALPNTGSEPLVLAMLGAGLLCAGAGIRLRLQAD